MNLGEKNSLKWGCIVLKKIILTLFLTVGAIVPFTTGKIEAAIPISEKDQLARVNWNINIGGYGEGCGGFYRPYYYPYYYPYPPPCAYPYPYPYPPCCGGYWWKCSLKRIPTAPFFLSKAKLRCQVLKYFLC